ncbi:MAG: dockerin type I repeat-containing protein, partial [Tepidisphaerales bacterium]
TITVLAGTYTLDPAASTLNPALSLVVGPGTVSINSSQSLASIAINSGGQVNVGAGAEYLIRTAGLSIAPGGVMDLGQSDMVISYTGTTPVDTVRQHIFAGRLITSVNTPAPGHFATLAQVDNNVIRQVSWSGTPISNGTDFNQVIIKHTYMGDTNLDGQVTAADYLNVIANQGRTNAQWFDGDFNHDGIVNADDLAQISLNLGAGIPGGFGPPLMAAATPAAPLAAKPAAAKASPSTAKKSVVHTKPRKPAKPAHHTPKRRQ